MLSQQLANGVVLGATYALFALGFTLIFGVLRVVNLLYGFYFSAGAFAALFLVTLGGAPLWLALPTAALGTGALAMGMDAVLFTRLRRAKAPELASLMVTLGAALALYALATRWLGPDMRRFPPGIIPGEALIVGSVRLGATQLGIVALALAFVTALSLLLRRTKLGLAIRALAENPDAARLMGIDTRATALAVSFLSGLTGGMAGVLIGLNFNAVEPFMGEGMMLRGFAVVIVGGLGDARGALAAGLLLGVLEVLTAGYLASSLKDAVGFAMLVATLWIRPAGLFGRASARRA